MRLEVSQVIERPVAAVFEWYAAGHVRNHPRWDPDIELWLDAEAPLEVGAVIRRRNSRFGTPMEGTMEVVEYDPPHAFGVVIREGPAETRGRTTFGALAPDRTALVVSADFPDLDDAVLTRVHSLMQRSVDNVKELLESEVPAGG